MSFGEVNYGSIVDPVHDLTEVFQGARVQPGQTIYLRGGTYTTVPVVTISGTAEAWITIRPYAAETVIFKPSSGDRALYINGNSYLDIQRIVFDGTNIAIDTAKVTNGAHHIRFTGCEFCHAPEQGMLVTGDTTTAIEFIDCVFHDNGTTGLDHGIYAQAGGTLLLSGCEAYNQLHGHGIHIHGGSPAGVWEVADCYTHNNSKGIGLYYGNGKVHGCTGADNLHGDILILYSPIQVECYNNDVPLCGVGPITTDPCAIEVHHNHFGETSLGIAPRLPDGVTFYIHDNTLGTLTIDGADLYNVTLENNT